MSRELVGEGYAVRVHIQGVEDRWLNHGLGYGERQDRATFAMKCDAEAVMGVAQKYFPKCRLVRVRFYKRRKP